MPSTKICNNFRGWFIIDLVAAIPFDLLLFGSDTDEVKKTRRQTLQQTLDNVYTRKSAEQQTNS